MAEEEFVLDGYCFSSQAEYDRARKERETIVYLTASTDSDDMKALLQVYNRFVSNASFQTIIGQQFLYELRRRLVGSQIVTEDTLAPVPVMPFGKAGGGESAGSGDRGTEAMLVKRYKKAYEDAVANRKIKNILIVILVLVIVGMFVITATTRDSISLLY